MKYKKSVIIALAFSLIVLISSDLALSNLIASGDKVYDGVLNVLQTVQKYSWPVAFLFFIFAIYKFYVAGAEDFEAKAMGQRLIIGVALCLAIIQCLPLIYAFIILK